MDSLRSLSAPTALVMRSGEAKHIAAVHVVPGDIILLKPGDVVPADARLFNTTNLEIEEALLTGEALPAIKTVETLSEHTNPSGEVEPIGVGDRTNMAFASTTVSKGRGTGLVVGTGMATNVGTIANALNGKKSVTDREEETHSKENIGKRIYEKLMLWLGLRTGTPLQIK